MLGGVQRLEKEAMAAERAEEGRERAEEEAANARAAVAAAHDAGLRLVAAQV